MRLIESSKKPLTASGKRLTGLFAELDTQNQNGRIYPKRIYEGALQELLPKISEGRLLGECDHPEDYDEVRLSNVSHVIRECHIDGNQVFGTIELLDTPAGKIAQALTEAGIPLGISSRGLGNTRRISEGSEVTDLQLITWDIVADPSFDKAVLTESAKIALSSKLNDIEHSLPMNESSNENQAIRNRINDIRENLDKAPTVTEDLITTIGRLTEGAIVTEKKLTEATSRNKALRANMAKLQESYNALSTKITKMQKTHDQKVAKLQESYESEIVALRKSLAIEKRGMSQENVMPLLEGLTSTEEIEGKLDTLRHLGASRQTLKLPKVDTLTEGAVTRKPTSLSKIISSI